MGLFESKLDKMTSAQLQAYAMKYGEENNMSDAAVQKMFGPKIKQKQAEETKGKNKMSKGGNATKKVPVVTIGVGMAEMKKNKKAEMAYGGMANGKKHMYACGGSVHSKK
jgi:xanthine dehydrogenase iron-sulfur cluster and FAD-binding subunit A